MSLNPELMSWLIEIEQQHGRKIRKKIGNLIARGYKPQKAYESIIRCVIL